MERLVAVPNTDVDIRTLPIGPEEAFVLSRVDGSRTEDEIALETGLDKKTVTRILSRLVEVGAVDLGLAAPRHQQRSANHPEPDSSRGNKVPSLYPSIELREDVALPRERRRQVLDWYYGFDLLNYYELLGLKPGADKKDVRESYFEVVCVFHPDKFFGKALGNYGNKLAKVFQRLTEIQDILTTSELRSEYDKKLQKAPPLSPEREAQRQIVTERISTYFATARAARAEEKRRERELAQQARTISKTPAGRQASPVVHPHSDGRAVDNHAKAPQPTVTVATATETPATPSKEPPAVVTAQPPPEESRRRNLLRRIRGSFPPNSQGVVPVVGAAEPAAEHADAGSPLRYLRMADEAIARNNPVSAASALRIALTSMPDNKEIAAKLAEAEQKAAEQMADQNLEQARAEEVHGRFDVAAELYASVALGRPSAGVFERTAVCFLSAKKDLKRAADFAKQALALSPDRADYHFLLGRIYAEANMQQSAINELERAAKLAPTDGSIKEWLKKVKRGELET